MTSTDTPPAAPAGGPPPAGPAATLDDVALDDLAATLATRPADVPPAMATWLDDDTVLEELLEAILDAAWPDGADAEPGVISTSALRQVLAGTLAPSLARLHATRTLQAARILGAVAGQLYQLWDTRRAADEVTALDVPRDAQHVRRHDLRKWAVAADLVADRAAQRVVSAEHGARWLADAIRRELTHPADVPALAPDRFEPSGLFDRRRAQPADPSDDRECGCRGTEVCGECTDPSDYEPAAGVDA